MNDLFLIKPTAAYAGQIAACRREFLERGEVLHGAAYLDDYEDIPAWLDQVERRSRRETCLPGRVPASVFLCVRQEDDKVVGIIDLRHELNDYLSRIGGHIGYCIRPDERGKGYAKVQLGLVLREAAKLGLDKVLITCDKSNEASRRTILAHGGVLENEFWDEDEKEFIQRYWVGLPQR